MEMLSLAALVGVITLSCFTRINPGLLAMGLAWVLGQYGGNMTIQQIAMGFPVYMFIVLVGVTYLFGLAKHNGTLERITHASVSLVKNNAFLSPVLFFFLAALLSTIGAGNIGAVALLAPVAMSVAWQSGIGAFFMTIVLICGANAGTFSPFALTGIIANGLIEKLNLPMDPWTQVYLPNFMAQSLLVFFCALIFSRYLKRRRAHHQPIMEISPDLPWTRPQHYTIGAIVLLIVGGVFFKADIGFLALLLACALTLLDNSDGKEAMKHIPWSTILMVCGVNMLIGVLEEMGGLGLLTDIIAKFATPESIIPITATVTGVISAFSSSSGVVLPTFIPLVPELMEKIEGGNAVAIVSSINVGAHLVDISPLSSLGAICLASSLHEDKEKLFRHLLWFGLSMALVGAGICYMLFSWIK